MPINKCSKRKDTLYIFKYMSGFVITYQYSVYVWGVQSYEWSIVPEQVDDNAA